MVRLEFQNPEKIGKLGNRQIGLGVMNLENTKNKTKIKHFKEIKQNKIV